MALRIDRKRVTLPDEDLLPLPSMNVFSTTGESPLAPIARFQDMNLSPAVLRAVLSLDNNGEKNNTPTSVQENVIPALLTGRDVVVVSGGPRDEMTVGWSIGLLERMTDVGTVECGSTSDATDIDAHLTHTALIEGLVLVSSQERADHVRDVIGELGRFVGTNNDSGGGGGIGGGGGSGAEREKDGDEDRRVVVAVGGDGAEQILLEQQLRGENEHDRALLRVFVGTPGQTRDLLGRAVLGTGRLRAVVVDSADGVDEQQFTDQIADVFQDSGIGDLDPRPQVTLTARSLADGAFTRLPELITVDALHVRQRQPLVTLQGVRQHSVMVEEDHWKFDTLCDICETVNQVQIVVFCNTRSRAMWLADKMSERSFHVALATSHTPQEELDDALENFFFAREGQILVVTDRLAQSVQGHHTRLFVNFDMPVHLDSYIERVGCGRTGAGVAITFVTDVERDALRELQDHYSADLSELPASFENYFTGEQKAWVPRRQPVVKSAAKRG
jgi:superfamily II DNA/RNA helicase